MCSIAPMTISISDAQFLLCATKQLVKPLKWIGAANRENKSPLIMLQTRVSIEDALPQGLWFRMTLFPARRDVATFQLDIEKPASRTHLELYRLEWRPVSGHGNSIAEDCPADLRGLVFRPGETHEHICTDNTVVSEGRIRASGVKSARKIELDFSNFDNALAYVCDKLKIENLRDIPKPNDQSEMF
jgi:hypothetical protein